jgi:hypothetical protein
MNGAFCHLSFFEGKDIISHLIIIIITATINNLIHNEH